ncbi:hypothetical protein C7B76_25620 [filamentous cyanobacterium CCP2]|nr:hypothetical protein C7B76_25620 [filamentous cyanobacterium CCP2]
MLSLLAWVVYLIVIDPNLKQFVALYGWGFLILGVDWFFLDDKEDKKKPTLPGLNIKLNIGPWITGALICLALLSYRFLLTDFPTALVAWPLVSAGVVIFRQCLRPGFKPTPFRVPNDAGVRQDLILLTLTAALFSCWFQFGILLENILDRYPSLAGDDFRNSAFVVRTSPATSRVPVGGTTLLNTAEAQVREELSGRPWLDVQRWLRDIEAQLPRLERQTIDRVYGIPARAEESQFWRLDADFEDALPNDILRLRLFWVGPSSQAGGYILEKVCLIQRAGLTPPGDAPVLGESYQMECQPITSNLPAEQPETEPTERGRIIE